MSALFPALAATPMFPGVQGRRKTARLCPTTEAKTAVHCQASRPKPPPREHGRDKDSTADMPAIFGFNKQMFT